MSISTKAQLHVYMRALINQYGHFQWGGVATLCMYDVVLAYTCAAVQMCNAVDDLHDLLNPHELVLDKHNGFLHALPTIKAYL